MAIALWPFVSSYLFFVAAFAPNKNFVVAVVSWLSLLRYWKPWAAATADLRHEVDLAIDLIFLAWFWMGVPIIVTTIWFGLKGVLCLAGNEIVRRIHDAMEFELDTDYLDKCYSPMTPGSIGDQFMALQVAASKPGKELVWQHTSSHLYLFVLDSDRPRPDLIYGKRPRRADWGPSFTEDQLRAQKEFKKGIMERARQVLAARKNGGTTVEQPIIDLKPTTSDIEEHAPAAPSVPQPRETQSSAWPTDPESENVTDDVTIANGQTETEEPADRTQSRGEGLVGPGPKAPEPETSSGVEGNGLPEGDEDSRAEELESSQEQEGESSAEEPKSSFEEEGEGPAEEPESSSEEDGEGLLYKVDPANDPEISFEVEGEAPSTATVPEAAQELESSYEEEGESLLNIDTAPTEELDTSMEVDGEGWSTMVPVPEPSSDDGFPVTGGNMDETSYGVESDVEMADAEPLEGMAVLRPSYDLCWSNSNSQETILPLEVAAAWPLAGQEPVSCDETRGWLDVSPAFQGAQIVVEAQ
ncbi:hypothetical protein TRIATDRAFT_322901 [Trichoderma atroviride IMI 206040]|uniref:Uncharacterized protein n=2 Tax=Hypocrea atroviridis TaxID=63577 RepID=G9P9Z8_HYPAI|nr:uncharacterized protein TRIATDRAFT_322901 [Trichoderma atroviride IMI 206040]EHK40469.1 hypothetical protein TRIATDRAFT_322901 [Trichoderma atroviride IMI 206040]